MKRAFRNRKFIFSALPFLCFAIAQAQEAKLLARHPGDVIKYEIKFDGPNADKIKHMNASLSMRAATPKDQAGFSAAINEPNVQPSAPQTFELSFQVPENIADGDYYLNFAAFADNGYGNYSDGQEFNVPPIHIENPKKFTPPAVSVKPLP